MKAFEQELIRSLKTSTIECLADPSTVQIYIAPHSSTDFRLIIDYAVDQRVCVIL